MRGSSVEPEQALCTNAGAADANGEHTIDSTATKFRRNTRTVMLTRGSYVRGRLRGSFAESSPKKRFQAVISVSVISSRSFPELFGRHQPPSSSKCW